MSAVTTIQIFLPDGDPRSLKIADIENRMIRAVLIPRAKLDYAEKRHEFASNGVYFLIGNDIEESHPLLYVGESKKCITRLKQHNKKKDFWNVAIAVVSKAGHFMRTHTKFLEAHCYAEAEKAGRFSLENEERPKLDAVPEAMRAGLNEDFETLKLLVTTLGYPIFEEIKKARRETILLCKGREANAKGEYTSEGLVVFAGSKCNPEVAPGADLFVRRFRENLILDGTLVLDGQSCHFSRNCVFPNPSRAASVVLGFNSNGWKCWKYNDGKTLNEVMRHA